MIPRKLTDTIVRNLQPGKVVGVFGARRTGKTYLMQHIQSLSGDSKILMINGENLDVAEILSSQRLCVLKPFLAGYDSLFVDEAQKIPGIGANLKLIVDSFPGLRVFVTGSSAFDLRNKIGEPLTGRSRFFYLYPIAQLEMQEDYLSAKEQLETRLIFGAYPQVIISENPEERTAILESIKNGVLLRDILMLDNQKDSLFMMNLLRLIAFQIGNDVSYNELANNLGVSKNTVTRYLNLLEKCYILFSLSGFSRNLRNEVSKSRRYFFWDNGIRNAIISSFNRLSLRDDTGKLWENYCIAERMKRNHYLGRSCNYYFWRTYQQKEIDLIEESDGRLAAYEFKWKDKSIKPPKEFLTNYKRSSFDLIHQLNYLAFIT